MALAMVKRPSYLNLLRITPTKTIQVTVDSVTFKSAFEAKKAQSNDPYGPAIALRQAEDECLCPVRLLKEYIAKNKD